MPFAFNPHRCQCCPCVVAQPVSFSDWQDFDATRPSVFWTDEGSGSVKTTTTGKRITEYPFVTVGPSDGSVYEFELDLDGVGQEYYNGYVFDSGAETVYNALFGETCSIGPPPWTCKIYQLALGGVGLEVNGVRTMEGAANLSLTHGFILNSGTSMQVSNFRWLAQGSYSGRDDCGIVGADAWYPHKRVSEVQLTITNALTAGCAACASRIGTFVLPFNAAGTGSGIASYKLTGGSFGCGATAVEAKFFSSIPLGVYTQQFSVAFGSDSPDVFTYLLASPFPCRQTLTTIDNNGPGVCHYRGVSITY